MKRLMQTNEKHTAAVYMLNQFRHEIQYIKLCYNLLDEHNWGNSWTLDNSWKQKRDIGNLLNEKQRIKYETQLPFAHYLNINVEKYTETKLLNKLICVAILPQN